ncbi:MAG: hypothetical protein WCQ83_05525 [Endomicrobiia bacterium]
MFELEDAKKKITENKYTEALVLLKIAEEKYPNNMDISFHFGKSYFYINKYDLAKIYMHNNENIKALDILLSISTSEINNT